jgi:hypothetical protein
MMSHEHHDPLKEARRFARLAQDAYGKGHWQQAIDKHQRAARSFAEACSLSKNAVAIETLVLLQKKHLDSGARIRSLLGEDVGLAPPSHAVSTAVEVVFPVQSSQDRFSPVYLRLTDPLLDATPTPTHTHTYTHTQEGAHASSSSSSSSPTSSAPPEVLLELLELRRSVQGSLCMAREASRSTASLATVVHSVLQDAVRVSLERSTSSLSGSSTGMQESKAALAKLKPVLTAGKQVSAFLRHLAAQPSGSAAQAPAVSLGLNECRSVINYAETSVKLLFDQERRSLAERTSASVLHKLLVDSEDLKTKAHDTQGLLEDASIILSSSSSSSSSSPSSSSSSSSSSSADAGPDAKQQVPLTPLERRLQAKLKESQAAVAALQVRAAHDKAIVQRQAAKIDKLQKRWAALESEARNRRRSSSSRASVSPRSRQHKEGL